MLYVFKAASGGALTASSTSPVVKGSMSLKKEDFLQSYFDGPKEDGLPYRLLTNFTCYTVR